jgi:hypothetical protein
VIRRAGIILAGIGINLVLIGPYVASTIVHEFGDFPQFYVGAKLGNLRYEPAAVMDLQHKLFGGIMPALMPVRLPFVYAAVYPLGRVRFSIAKFVWLFTMLGCVAAAVFLTPLADRWAFATALAFCPVLKTILGGQDDALLCLILVAGLRLRSCGRPFASGLVLSLLAIKFHLFLLLPFAFEAAVLHGFLAGGVGLLAVSFIYGGLDWPLRYAHLLSTAPIGPGAWIMPNLHSGLHGFPVLEVLTTVATGVLTIVWIRRRPEQAIRIALVGSFLISFHSYAGDLVVLSPVLLGLFQRRGSLRAWLMLSPFPQFVCSLGGGFIAAGLLTAVFAQLAQRSIAVPIIAPVPIAPVPAIPLRSAA